MYEDGRVHPSRKGGHMNYIFMNELKNKCSEIAADSENSAGIDKVIEAYDRVMQLQNLARKEGLLALEAAIEPLDMNDQTQAYLFKMITMVVDGTDPELLAEIGINTCISRGLTSYDGLIMLMYYRGACMIQCGENPRVIEWYLKSLLPDTSLTKLEKKACEGALSYALKEAEDDESLLRYMTEDGKEIDEKDHSITGQTAQTLCMLSDIDMQRLLRDTDNFDLVIAMKGLPGVTRKHVFKNMSRRLAVMIAQDMEAAGPVRMKDVEEACVKIMKRIIRLENIGEIQPYDLSMLQLVIDMYDSAEQENRMLKDKYRELKKMLDRIYAN